MTTIGQLQSEYQKLHIRLEYITQLLLLLPIFRSILNEDVNSITSCCSGNEPALFPRTERPAEIEPIIFVVSNPDLLSCAISSFGFQ